MVVVYCGNYSFTLVKETDLAIGRHTGIFLKQVWLGKLPGFCLDYHYYDISYWDQWGDISTALTRWHFRCIRSAFSHTRQPMSALINVFSSPEQLGYRETIWLPQGWLAPLAISLKPWRRYGMRASVWSELKCVCLKGGRLSDKGVWTSGQSVVYVQRDRRRKELTLLTENLLKSRSHKLLHKDWQIKWIKELLSLSVDQVWLLTKAEAGRAVVSCEGSF